MENREPKTSRQEKHAMIIRQIRQHRRPGAAAIETALVMLPMMMFLTGVFEYGRFLMVWNLVNNAAREGCRYALVNNTAATISADVTTVVNNFMGSQVNCFTGFTVTVSGTHAGASTAVNSLVPGDSVTVTVTGKFKFMNTIPVVPMPSNLSITSAVTMLCEGGT
jgi:Flp pilus assembly protein TadG